MRSFAVGLGNILIGIAIMGSAALAVEYFHANLMERQASSPSVAHIRSAPAVIDSAPAVDAIPGEADADLSAADSPSDADAAEAAADEPSDDTAPGMASPPDPDAAPAAVAPAAAPVPQPDAKPAAPKVVPITRLQIPSISLDSEVVPAKYVKSGGGTWIIPPFKVGHAELTAGAGQIGNGLLFGHVTSVSVGNIFEQLDKVDVGDDVEVYSPDQEFLYRVVEVRAVSRDDVSVLDPTNTATISMITCTGNWLPLERDYDERLIVRAQLVKSLPSSA